MTPISVARNLSDGTAVTIEGVLTTRLGALEAARAGFVQDATGGIALYLDAAVVGDWPAGATVIATGTVDSRFAQRTLRLSEADLVGGSPAPLPDPLDVPTGSAIRRLGVEASQKNDCSCLPGGRQSFH